MNVHDREEMVISRLHALAPHLDGEPDPEFRAATRARLIAMAAVRTPAPAPAPLLKRLLAGRRADAAPARWQTRLTAGIAGAALTVTAAAALVAVAADAQPGDVLYGVKRGSEQTQLALAGDSRGPTLLDFAATRLDELESMVDAPTALPAAAGSDGGMTVLAAGADAALVLDTLATMDDQTIQGAEWMAEQAVDDADDGPLTDLGAWAAQQADGLAALQPLVPAAAESAVSHSLVLLSDITVRSDRLQEALGCPAGPAVQGTDALGPRPTACAPAEAPPPASGGDTGTGGTGTGTGTATSVGTDPAAPQDGTDPAPPTAGSNGGPVAVPTTPAVPGLPSLPTRGQGVPSISVPVPTVTQPGSVLPSLEVNLCAGKIIDVGNC